MRKTLLLTIITAIAGLLIPMRGALTADWQMHLPFDDWASKVIGTSGRIYFLNRSYEYNVNITGRDFNSYVLHYYDKAGDEVLTLSTDNDLSDNLISCVSYNPDKKYLLIVYTNSNIDFLYDDGRVENVSALKMFSMPGKKEVNSITFDNKNNLVYLATNFGYVALNDQKHEVAESRNYNEKVKSLARCGDYLVMILEGGVYTAKVKDPRFSLQEYHISDTETPVIDELHPLGEDRLLAVRKGYDGLIYHGTINSGSNVIWEEKVKDGNIIDVIPQKDGSYQITGNVLIYSVNPTEEYTNHHRPEAAWKFPACIENGKTIWSLTSRKGLRKYDLNSSGQWAVTKDYMRPNSPATFISTSLEYHPTYGMLAGSNGVDIALNNNSQATPLQVSALKNGFWKEYSPLYTNPSGLSNSINYTGLSIDPQNPKYIYRGSFFNGIVRLNLEDPTDILVLAHPASANKDLKGFIKAFDNMSWNALCRVTPPQFDTEGTMWTLHNNMDTHQGELYYWTAADRAATTSAQNYRPMGKIIMPPVLYSGNNDLMIKLTYPKNKNIIAIGGFSNFGSVLLYDTNGTLNTTSDDKYVYINSPMDQDGGMVIFQAVNNLWEDPTTGLLWIMTQRGIFTVNPVSAFENPKLVNRIKVSRNDGTQLADYLLNEVNVNDMTTDGEGRKWFATSNGLVCTSSDGRTVYGEFSTTSSNLPEDNIYILKYNPENNSMMLGSGQGLIELFPSGSGQNSDSSFSGPRIYPNPVEPDYYGWVHIDNISDGSLVKITDSQGGIVKELGPVRSGSVEWDVTNMHNSRVSTGVYYVMVSPGNGMSGDTSISKILVLN